jgi:hypothetical protein
MIGLLRFWSGLFVFGVGCVGVGAGGQASDKRLKGVAHVSDEKQR